MGQLKFEQLQTLFEFVNPSEKLDDPLNVKSVLARH